MQMEMTIGDLMVIREDLRKLFSKEIPIKTAWKISKFISLIENEYNDFENSRLKLVKKFVPENENKIPDDKMEAFRVELEQLLNIPVKIDIDKISIEELGDITISPLSLSKMSFLFKDKIDESNILTKDNINDE